ncbi:MAG: cysteine--tRNA ligase [Rickettsiaceae bacterium]
MKLSLFNTVTRKREEFNPLDINLVKMYVCGPTVYDHPHIGNARSAVVYDILYRVLIQLYGQNKVLYVRNITDIDDKIIDRSLQLGIPISELTEKTIIDYNHDMNYLSCLKPTKEPKATEHLPQMIDIIDKLLNLTIAYKVKGYVYFDVSKAKNYTKLSGRTFEEMQESGRIESDKNKKNPTDFVLWKPAEKNDPESAKFASPFGTGRPGWHIECSAMSHQFLGPDFDIHGGGADLIFPHHTNEIAQSCSAFPDSKYARYWVHNGFLTVNHEKMSKSLGNFITVRDLMDKQIKGDLVKLLLLSTHYRKPLDYNKKALDDAEKTLNYWYRAIEDLDFKNVSKLNFRNDALARKDLPQVFLNALLDDLNTPVAIKIINDFAKEAHATISDEAKIIATKKMLHCAQFMGLMRINSEKWFKGDLDYDHIKGLIDQRLNAKEKKNWQLADQIRDDLAKLGVVIEDKSDGSTVWKKINKS